MANVMGARADGWWRDRAGAAARLCREVMALAERGIGADTADTADTADATDTAERSFPSYVLVLEGRARPAAAMIENGSPLVRVVSAAGSGDDTIVEVVGEIVEIAPLGASCLVVTADRELRRRCERLGAAVAGPGWVLSLL